jgi:1-acyl-sn-glycerol-3-phosphate acyltransferase
LRRQIEAMTTDLLGTPPDDVVLAPPHSVAKTSSGKIRRAATRERYEQGALGQGQRAVWWQVVRLAAASVWPQLRRVNRDLSALLFAGYFWSTSALVLLSAWSLIALLPHRPWRQSVARTATRGLLRLLRTRFVVQGLEHLPVDRPYVLVANHASYLDGFVLTAALPTGISYVVKRELQDTFASRLLLQRLGAIFVERFDAQRGIEDTEHTLQLARQGCAIAFFPEGTLRRTPGVMPFRMGAFMVAVQASLPVVPLGISGTRTMLRGEQWFPRRSTLRVTIGVPIPPKGNDWNAAVALRDAARAQVVRYSGEPDLVQTPGADDATPNAQAHRFSDA